MQRSATKCNLTSGSIRGVRAEHDRSYTPKTGYSTGCQTRESGRQRLARAEKAHDILDLLRKVERRGSIKTAKRIRQRISGVFVLAISQTIARDNPAALLEHALLPKKKAKKLPAIVDLDELREIQRKTEGTGAYCVTTGVLHIHSMNSAAQRS